MSTARTGEESPGYWWLEEASAFGTLQNRPNYPAIESGLPVSIAIQSARGGEPPSSGSRRLSTLAEALRRERGLTHLVLSLS